MDQGLVPLNRLGRDKSSEGINEGRRRLPHQARQVPADRCVGSQPTVRTRSSFATAAPLAYRYAWVLYCYVLCTASRGRSPCARVFVCSSLLVSNWSLHAVRPAKPDGLPRSLRSRSLNTRSVVVSGGSVDILTYLLTCCVQDAGTAVRYSCIAVSLYLVFYVVVGGCRHLRPCCTYRDSHDGSLPHVRTVR